MKYDVFISHAGEDKPLARKLALCLMNFGYRVWFDETVLTAGDNLREKIDDGLANCLCGVVVLSPHFFRKNWPKIELDALVARKAAGENVIIPVWYNITADELRKHSPILSALVGINVEGDWMEVLQSTCKAIKKRKHKPTVGVPGGCPKCREGELKKTFEGPSCDGPIYSYECTVCDFSCNQGFIDFLNKEETREHIQELVDRQEGGQEILNDLITQEETKILEGRKKINEALHKIFKEGKEGKPNKTGQ